MSAQPNPSRRPPKYCLRKATGQAVVQLAGRDLYLRQYGSDANREKYAELLARWNSQQLWDEVNKAVNSPATTLSVAELILRYREFAKDYY